MDIDAKVFSSDIQRGKEVTENNLYELINLVPAIPSTITITNGDDPFYFKPVTGKLFEPKKRIRGSKVKTVRDVRIAYEREVNVYLTDDLNKQESFLFKRIRYGSSRLDNTVKIAVNLLRGDQPISRPAWQMLANMNPSKNNNALQYVLWNGQTIHVTGSKGGERKFLCSYDLGKRKCSNHKTIFKSKKQRLCLLKKSLATKFKPGPLSRKQLLDCSYQKKSIGFTQTVKLPKIGLDVEPTLGVSVEPTIANILNTIREDEDGKLTETWATFSLSTLGTLNTKGVIQSNCEKITFDLNFKNNQNHILMRCDVENGAECIDSPTFDQSYNRVEEYNVSEIVNDVVGDMLQTVEISLSENEMFTKEEEDSQDYSENQALLKLDLSKDKTKKKRSELDKLDVTVIRVSELGESEKTDKFCKKSFCTMGCVCLSLLGQYSIKNHCGRADCMFKCSCDFSKYKPLSSLDRNCMDLIPGLLNLDSKINSGLAKEEKKFHQTVVVTEQRSILLKSQRRYSKTPKRYAEYFDTIDKKSDDIKKILTISALRLDCKNVEVWCMVHNLYKCFCKGRFMESIKPDPVSVKETDTVAKVIREKGISKEGSYESGDELDVSSVDSNDAQIGHEDCNGRLNTRNKVPNLSQSHENTNNKWNPYTRTSARIRKFGGKRFSDTYYTEMNKKIKLMEENDQSLHQKMMIHFKDAIKQSSDDSSGNIQEISSESDEPTPENRARRMNITCETAKHFPNKTKLIGWLEANYKHYKQRIGCGNKNIPLEAPKPGKISLYPWEVILERYRMKKNYFVVTMEEPYRIFMAVDLANPFFNNCMNINSIPFEDLKKYPVTVSNILQDIGEMKDNFYILCGLPECWELIGSVTKLKDKNDVNQSSDSSNSEVMSPNEVGSVTEETEKTENVQEETSSQCKWFVMIVVNDFIEIQFQARGFFVKYDNIIKAINVAQVTGKTVRLSSQKKTSNEEYPQFGIYAIPYFSDQRVYIGPYEVDDDLGIDIIPRKGPRLLKGLSRGVWLYKGKTENSTMIDNPLDCMPDVEKGPIIYLNKKELLEKEEPSPADAVHDEDIPQPAKLPPPELAPITTVKVVKPIKINKTNGFYRLQPNTTLLKSPIKSVAIMKPGLLQSQAITMPTPIIKDTFSLVEPVNTKVGKVGIPRLTKIKPVAEIAPQQKSVEAASKKLSYARGMLILKPEEINKRASQSLSSSTEVKLEETALQPETQMDMDIENFLATSEVCQPPNVFVVSDDEDEPARPRSPREVYIECVNVESLGWIRGKKNHEDKLSFEFPGFKFTDYYEDEEAFTKINQVMSRKVYIVKNLALSWQVVESVKDLIHKDMLKSENLGSDFVLTSAGIRHKRDLLRAGLPRAPAAKERSPPRMDVDKDGI